MSVVFEYHSTRPSDFSDIGGGAKVGVKDVEYTGNLEHMAAEGAILLDLEPGRYLAVQAATKGDNCGHGIVIGWSWIIEVTTPVAKEAKVVKHEATR